MDTTPYQYLRYMEIFLLGTSLFLLETLPSVKTRESRNTHSQKIWEKVCEPKPIYHSFCQLFSFLVVTEVAFVTFNGPTCIKKFHSFVEGR